VSAIGLIQVNRRPPAEPDPVTRITLKLKLPGKARAGRKLKAKATIRNTGNTVIPDVILKPAVPRKLAVKPRKAKARKIAVGAKAKRTIAFRVKKNAKGGSKLRFRLTALVGGRTLKKVSRTVRILEAR
ncbi:MAG: hypothetical protein WBP55_07245, partial [Solirubrobacterales bacterium]